MRRETIAWTRVFFYRVRSQHSKMARPGSRLPHRVRPVQDRSEEGPVGQLAPTLEPRSEDIKSEDINRRISSP
jgi:hypothetical protein